MTNRGVVLLQEGEKFLEYVLKILEIKQEMEESFQVDSCSFNLGTTQTISHNYLYTLYLKQNFNIFIRPIKELITMYNQSLIDILILNRRLDELKTKKIQSYSEKICWVKSFSNLNDMFNKPIAISRNLDYPYRKETLTYLDKYSKNKTPMIIEVDSLDILITMVEKNEAIAILPCKSVEMNNKLKELKAHKLQDIVIYIYYNKFYNKTKNLLQFIKEQK